MSLKLLNQDEQSSKRLKFAKLGSRLERISVGVDVKQLATSKGEDNPYLQQELERLRELDSTTEFRRFYYKLWPLTQSLPEILHHLSTIVDLLIDRLEHVLDDSLPSILRLVSFLARDLQDDLFPYFHPLMTSVLNRLQTGSKSRTGLNPELVGNMIECISYLLK